MKKILALTDRDLSLVLKNEKMSDFTTAIDNTDSLEFVKVGCEFCSKLFNAIDIVKFIGLCELVIKKRLKLMLTVPTIKAVDRHSFEKIKEISSSLDPIIWQVNDFGSFCFIKGLSDKNMVCAGRLFDKGVRDIRINEYEEVCGPLPEYQYTGYLNALRKYGFCGAAIDNYRLDALCFEKIKDFFLIINENVVLSVTGRECFPNCHCACNYERIRKFDEEWFVLGNALLWNPNTNSNVERFDIVEKSFRL